MPLNHIFDIAGSALRAETTRLQTSASNMSNANVVSNNKDETYRPQYPVFKSVQADANNWLDQTIKAGVVVDGIVESDSDPLTRYEPNNPLADENGFVYTPNINYVEEMTNMISASRSYQMDIEMLNTTKQLMLKTLQLGE